MKIKMPIIVTGQRWSPKEGENVIRVLPSTVPGGEAMQYEPQITVKILKNRNEKSEIEPEIDVVGNNLVAAAELEELCEWHDEEMERDRGFLPGSIEDKIGEAGFPDMAANAAMLREQLRVETNVRLALAEKQDAPKPFFLEEPKRYTMKDIGVHVDRIVHVEYWETIKLLQEATEGMTL
jgi:hypothetical protein